jgi:pyruvate,water dikinase
MFDVNMNLSQGIGNKAKFLMELKENGFNVPAFFILSSEKYNKIVDFNDKRKAIADSLLKLTKDNIDEISKDITSLFSGFAIP